MKLSVMVSLFVITSGALADQVTWTWFTAPALVSQSSGLDGFWGTADDTSGASINTIGAASSFFLNDGRFGYFAGTFAVDYGIDFVAVAAGEFGSTTAAWESVSLDGEFSIPFSPVLNAPYSSVLETGFAPANVNTVTLFDDNRFSNDFLLTSTNPLDPGVFETIRYIQTLDGYSLFRGQDPATVFANPDVVTHFNTIIPLLPAEWTAVAMERNTMTVLTGVSAGFSGGATASFYTTAPIDESACAASLDTDNDGVNNLQDNCVATANADQMDTDADGLGNACDADLTNDCAVSFGDLAEFKAAFFPAPYNPEADFDGLGTVNFGDLAFMKSTFFNGDNPGPGPSCVPNICDGD